MPNCTDCKHEAHQPGLCPYDNCGESEIVHSRHETPEEAEELYVPDYLN